MTGSDWRRASIELDTNLVRLYGRCQTCVDGFNIEHWQRDFGTKPLHPLLSDMLPPHLHLLSLYARSLNSDDVVIRLHNLHDQNQERSFPLLLPLNELLDTTQQVNLRDLRETSLSAVYEYGPPTSVGEGLRVPYPSPVDALHYQLPISTISLLNSDKQLRVKDVQQGKQNADEDGVFISDAALSKQNTDEEGVFISDAALKKDKQQQQAPLQANDGSRRLLQFSKTNQMMVSVSALQLRTFVVSLVQVKPAAEETNKLQSILQASKSPPKFLSRKDLPSYTEFYLVLLLSVGLTIAFIIVLRERPRFQQYLRVARRRPD